MHQQQAHSTGLPTGQGCQCALVLFEEGDAAVQALHRPFKILQAGARPRLDRWLHLDGSQSGCVHKCSDARDMCGAGGSSSAHSQLYTLQNMCLQMGDLKHLAGGV